MAVQLLSRHNSRLNMVYAAPAKVPRLTGRWAWIIVAQLVLCLGAPCVAGALQHSTVSGVEASGVGYAEGRILVQPKPTVSLDALAVFHDTTRSTVLQTFNGIGRLQVIALPAGELVPNYIDKYQQSGLVEFAEPDFIMHTALVPDDPKFTDGTTWGLNRIQAPAAWDVLTSATNIIVAVLDSGVRYTHEDLAANMWVNSRDGGHGWNAIARNNDPWDDSTDAHGTQMAGVIGAVGNNGKGLVGVAWGVQLMACKCFSSSGSGTNSDIIACMEYARTNGARILNASWSVLGSANISMALSNAIYAARAEGIIFVTAAGNNYPPVNIDITPCYPANFQIDNIVTAAYTSSADTLGVLSNYGATNVDFAAPGESIYSTYNTGDASYFGFYSGTSFAAAYVSGAFALLLAEYPTENYHQIIIRVLSATDPLPSLAGKCVTGGRLNLRKALTPIRLTPIAPATNGPFQFQVSAATNLTCVVQGSSDWVHWAPLFTNTTSANGTFDFTDRQSTNWAHRLYRAVASP
ncbi:MAG: S8 family peptidase [Verrucomicrobia bacterium]|nr:S8 family peptidase [Verrucomicrobiota bacterium]